MRREELYIGGEWVRPHGAGEIQVINPTTEEIIGSVPVGNSDDINHAVSAARSAFESWSMSPIEDRIKIHVGYTSSNPLGIDTESDLEKVKKMMGK